MSTPFRYRAATPAGEVREGVLLGTSRDTVMRELRGQRLLPVQVEPAVAERAPGGGSLRGRAAAVTVWARELATLLDAGLPLDRALGVTARYTDHRGLAAVVAQVRQEVRGGASLSDALERHPRYFPPLVPALVRAGEASGALEGVVAEAAEHLEETAELRAQIRTALLYPALMGGVASLGVLVLLVFVIPRFTGILEDVGGTLPLTTRLLVAGSGLLVGWWWLWLGLIAVGVEAGRRTLQDPAARLRFDAWRLGWPWLGDLERKYLTARFTRTLGLLLGSGVPIVGALRIARDAVGNRAARAGIERAGAQVAEGGAVALALEGTLHPMAVRMLTVGEESGRLESLCLRVARTFDAEVRRTLRTLVAFIEPALILVFGALVGFVAIAMLQAIYSINTGVL